MTWVALILRHLFLAMNLHLQLGRNRLEDNAVSVVRELNLRKEKRRNQQQKFLKRKRYKKEKLDRRFKSTRPKDYRFSDQKRIRRMYRND